MVAVAELCRIDRAACRQHSLYSALLSDSPTRRSGASWIAPPGGVLSEFRLTRPSALPVGKQLCADAYSWAAKPVVGRGNEWRRGNEETVGAANRGPELTIIRQGALTLGYLEGGAR